MIFSTYFFISFFSYFLHISHYFFISLHISAYFLYTSNIFFVNIFIIISLYLPHISFVPLTKEGGVASNFRFPLPPPSSTGQNPKAIYLYTLDLEVFPSPVDGMGRGCTREFQVYPSWKKNKEGAEENARNKSLGHT